MATITPLDYRPPAGAIKPPVKKEDNREVFLQVDDFPYCCAIRVIGQAETDEGESEAISESHIQAMKTALENNEEGASLLLYTTTQNQVAERAALQAAGYSVVANFINRNTHNNIWLHAKVVHQPRERRPRGTTRRRRR
jgi:hypothetical protein